MIRPSIVACDRVGLNDCRCRTELEMFLGGFLVLLARNCWGTCAHGSVRCNGILKFCMFRFSKAMFDVACRGGVGYIYIIADWIAPYGLLNVGGYAGMDSNTNESTSRSVRLSL